MSQPKVSVALPVRNAAHALSRAIESVLGQTLGDLELVIADNASSDGTPDLCREYAKRDPRVRFLPNERDIGILANFNQLVGLARGRYFRWLGSDDWLEPEYAEATAAALDAHPEAIAVTTYQVHWDDAGNRHHLEYDGPRLDSPHPEERFARMLWFLQQDLLLLDPNYSLHRREVLAGTRLHRMIAWADRILAAELALRGPFVHVPRCLSNRRYAPEPQESLHAKCRPPGQPPLDPSRFARFRQMLHLIGETELDAGPRLRCQRAAVRYYATDVARELRIRVRGGLSRAVRRTGIPVERLRRGRANRAPWIEEE